MATIEEAYKLNDELLIKLVLEYKDTAYFGIIYDRYVKKVYNKCLSFVYDKTLAKDLTHDVFLKVFLGLKSFSYKSKFSTWLYAITYNYCIDFLKQNSKEHIKLDIYEQNKISNSENMDEVDLFQIKVDRLKVLVKHLTPRERMILFLKYQDELSITEIRSVLDLSESAIKMRLKRARDKLLKLYKDMYSESIT